MGDHVGEIELALRILVGQAREPALEQRRRCGQDARVDLGDLALQRCRVLLLHDRPHRRAGGVGMAFWPDRIGIVGLRRAHDASVAERVGEIHRQQRERPAGACVGQRAQRGRADQRHVAVEDQRDAVVRQRGHRLLDGVAGAQLGHLAHEHALVAGERRFDGVGAVARDDDAALGPERLGRGHHMAQQRRAAQRMQHLGSCRAHPRALARGHDHDAECHKEIPVRLREPELSQGRKAQAAGALVAAAGGVADGTIGSSTRTLCALSSVRGKSFSDASNIAAMRRSPPEL
jgi:hypothetical protein